VGPPPQGAPPIIPNGQWVPLPGRLRPNLADPERGEAMHVSRRKVLGIVAPVLLVSATATTAISLTARAQTVTYLDTAVVVQGAITDETFAGSGLSATNDSNKSVIDLSGTGVTWSLHNAPSGISVSGTTNGAATISYSGSASSTGPILTAVATDSSGNAETIAFSVVLGNGTIQSNGSTNTTSVADITATPTKGPNVNYDNSVLFGANLDPGDVSTGFTFAESNLPAGLTSANPLIPDGGTAAPGSYKGVKVTATYFDGAVLSGTFLLVVEATTIYPSTYGDYVNKFGYGFDVFREQKHPGALIVGWPFTYDDTSTHFFLNNGTHAGAYQIEYAPNAVGTGLCVSDPGGGWAADPSRDGLILAKCNSSRFQQFVPQPNGTLKNLGTGLYVSPNGKGAQLRGERRASGSSAYTWKLYTSLPVPV
jgi:hypothetical protein